MPNDEPPRITKAHISLAGVGNIDAIIGSKVRFALEIGDSIIVSDIEARVMRARGGTESFEVEIIGFSPLSPKIPSAWEKLIDALNGYISKLPPITKC